MAITIEEILTEAVRAGASDVHVTAGTQPMMRINGKLMAMSYPKLFSEDVLTLFISIMTEPQRLLFEERGEYDMTFGIRELGRFRVNAYKQRGSIALAIRLTGADIPSPEELGIPEQVLELCGKRKGLVIAAGESGSGVTTTLAAIVDRINSTHAAHIITLENPIEYMYSHKKSVVDQREIGLDCRSYADGLRAAMREDADVILVGDMSEAATIEAAIAAAEAGHLILASLHVADAADAIGCIIDAFPPQRQEQIRKRLAKVLEMVMSQKLVPDETGTNRTAAFRIVK